MEPLVSVIIPNLNGEKFLKGCFESLRAQSYKNFEIIFVDNGSDDGSVDFILKNYPETKLITNKTNLGFAQANNQGFKIANGKYMATLNNDTRADKEWLENLVLTAEKNEKTGIFSNGDPGFELCRLISNWTKDLTLYTNGRSTLTMEQAEKLKKHNISIVEKGIDGFENANGQIQNIVFNDNSKTPVTAMYARPEFVQHSEIPLQLGCELSEQGLVKVDTSQKTTMHGVFACGDNSNSSKDIALAVSTGMVAGGACNKEIIQEEF